ncbi:hypothetical protein APSETT445_000008 [Aspergillus pseudonomiae]
MLALRESRKLLKYSDDKHWVCSADTAELAGQHLFTRLDAVPQIYKQIVEVIYFIEVAAVITTDPLKNISKRSNTPAAAAPGFMEKLMKDGARRRDRRPEPIFGVRWWQLLVNKFESVLLIPTAAESTEHGWEK